MQWRQQASSRGRTEERRGAPHAAAAHVGLGRRRLGGARGVRRGARRGGHARRCSSWRRPRPGERVLELACGAGGVGIAAAPLVGAGGEVVLSDVAPEMTAIARGRAEALGLEQRPHAGARPRADRRAGRIVRRRLLPRRADARARPGARGAEIARVLRPGGRVALAVWGPREQNPWLGVVFDAVTRGARHPDAAPGHPGPVLALRRGRARRSARRRGPRATSRSRRRNAVPRRVGRGVVGEDGGARGPARAAAGRAPRAGAPGAVRPRARRDQRLRDAGRAGDPRRVADRGGARA